MAGARRKENEKKSSDVFGNNNAKEGQLRGWKGRRTSCAGAGGAMVGAWLCRIFEKKRAEEPPQVPWLRVGVYESAPLWTMPKRRRTTTTSSWTSLAGGARIAVGPRDFSFAHRHHRKAPKGEGHGKQQK